MPKNILLVGFGKMGKELLRLAPKYDMQISCLLLNKEPIEDLPIPWHTSFQSISIDTVDLAIDFSSPHGIVERTEWLFDHHIPLVQGTTGWEDSKDTLLATANKKKASFVWSNNFSHGLFLFKQIVETAAKLLPKLPDFDVALMEAHHRKKKDSPSGTLLSLQKTVLDQLNTRLPGCSSKKSPLDGPEVDVASLRVGHIPGYHSLWIDGPSESIQLTHSVRSRSVFAEGALFAANMLLQTPGVFSFDDLLTERLLYV